MSEAMIGDEALSERNRTMQGNRNPGWLGTVDQYTVLEKLGGGAFGTVYLAEDNFSKTKYALKTVASELKANRDELENLREKFALVHDLAHPHIAGAYELHEARTVEYANGDVRNDLRLSPGDPVMVMRYAPGVTLSKWRKNFPGGRVPADKALAVCRQIADALDYAHGRKVVHRDVKPGNVHVLEADGAIDVQVLDFGLAAQIRTSMSRTSRARYDTSGTRPYMAPEQWAGRDQDGRTDQYALAVVLYELLSGDVPFGYVFASGDVERMESKVMRSPPLSIPGLPDVQNRALIKALAKEPADRFPTCTEFLDAFEGRIDFSDAPPSGAEPAAPAPAARPASPAKTAPAPPAGDGLSALPADAAFVARAWLFLRNGTLRGFRAVRRGVRAGAAALADRFPGFAALLDRFGWKPESAADESGADDAPAAAAAQEDDWVSIAASMPTPKTTTVDLGGGLSFEMVDLPAGVFAMGSRNGRNAEPGRQPGESRHRVRLTKPFQLAAAPVTRGKWRAVVGTDPSKGAGTSDDLPVDGVSWEDCRAFCEKLNVDHPVRGYRWRLPTEAQWEFACRAGTPGPYAGTGRLDDMGWYKGNSDGAAHPVRSKKPNAWGFYDMHGNVWEWCADGWLPSLGHEERTDPCAAPSGTERVVRGGSWNNTAAFCRSAARRGMARTARFDSVGFRVALVPEA